MYLAIINALQTPFSFIKSFISKGHDRSVKAKKNIFWSFLIKGLSISASLILLPITIEYVNPTQYGIWLTLSSIIGWFGFFDLGFGNGLRNKFAESIAKGDSEAAKIYVSTTYAALSIFIAIGLSIFICIYPFVNWARILNAPQSMAQELSLIALIVFIFFCLQFILQLVTTILTAKQESAKASFLNFLGSIISLLIVFVLTRTTSGSLFNMALALSLTPVFVLLAASFWFYLGDYKRYSPSIKYVKFNHVKSLLGLGLKFFVIQISVLILFQSDNIIITHILGPENVTTFNVGYKLFAVVLMGFNIIITPLWSAFTDAYANNDIEWIRSLLLKMKKVWIGSVCITIVLLIISPFIFKIWMGDAIQIPFLFSASLSLYMIAYTWQTIHVYFLNGIGKVGIQLILIVISSLLNIPIAIFLGSKLGIAGVTLGNAFLFLIMGIVLSIQSNKIIHNKAVGLWNR